MIFEKLTSTIPEFTHIIHVADIHIRLTKRHAEYREVFQRFYEDVAKSPETTVVVVAGDVVHSKSDLSPECVQMVSDFLFTLANFREVILIPGNHDATLSNKTRLDSLSPIVDALAHPRIHYLKETKLYGLGNVLFNNMCIFDNPEKYILGKDIPEIYRNQYKHVIALFHGPVDRSVTDNGFTISNPAIIPELFEWHHIALLGDIHRRQNIQEAVPEEHKPCIHYPSSLLQQNHGESLHPHGYTLWNLSNYEYQYKEVPNDYGFFTVDLHGSKILTDLSDLPKKTYLRVRCLDAIPTDVKAAEAIIATLTEVLDPSHIRIESESEKRAKEARVCSDVKLAEVTNIDYQGTLIEEYLRTKLGITDEDKIDRILLINRDVNTEVKKDEFARNLRWKPVRFEWDNMFAYGEGNHIDFTQMSGIYGIFGPNTCGKSSIFSALCFCLFDKWERGFKAVVARNSSKEGFRCKFEFTIGDIHYFIEKTGEETKSGNVRVDVKFWKTVKGVDEDLTDVMRRKTVDVIADYIGSFDDFILTTLSIQNSTKNNINFIDMGNTDRKDLLVRFMGLIVFDRLYDIGYARGKELAAKLKLHKDKNYVKERDDAKVNLENTETAIRDCQDSIDDLSRQIRAVNDGIVAEAAKFIPLDKEVPTDFQALDGRRNQLYVTLTDLEDKLAKDRVELTARKAKLDRLTEELSEISEADLTNAHKQYETYRKQLEEAIRKRDFKKVYVINKLDRLEKLRKKYNYDPKCKYCMENVSDKNADTLKTEQELKTDQKELVVLEAAVVDFQKKADEWNWVTAVYQDYTKRLSEHAKTKDEFTTLNTKILLAEKDAEKISQTIKEIERKIELYHRNEASVEVNQRVNMVILSYKNALNKLESFLNEKNKQLLAFTGNREVLKKQIQSTSEIIDDLMKTEEERQLYEYYGQAVGRNGIPYQVICNTIPEITREINSVLTQITDFTVEIEADEKNIVPYVNYDTKGRWPIEMTSGFERFAASVAIRIALNTVSNLPRTNFFVIDEGWGTLDKENRANIPSLLSVLRHHCEFAIIISHLDELRDFVDKQIEVSREGNFSKVVFK